MGWVEVKLDDGSGWPEYGMDDQYRLHHTEWKKQNGKHRTKSMEWKVGNRKYGTKSMEQKVWNKKYRMERTERIVQNGNPGTERTKGMEGRESEGRKVQNKRQRRCGTKVREQKVWNGRYGMDDNL